MKKVILPEEPKPQVLDTGAASKSPLAPGQAINLLGEESRARFVKYVESHRAAPGELGLPPLLDKRRLELHIPDQAFDVQAVFDRILVYQVDKHRDSETFAGTSILRAQTSRRRQNEEAPRGVLVSAGLQALDQLRSHGMDLGYFVNFIRLAPWRMEFAQIEGTEEYLLVLRVGDLIGSETLQQNLRAGRCKTELRREPVVDSLGHIVDYQEHHVHVDDNGKSWEPRMVDIPADY